MLVCVCAVHLCVSAHKTVYDISWLWIDSMKSLATKCIYVSLDEYRRALKLYRIYILIIAHTILTDESIAQQWRRVNANENKIKSKRVQKRALPRKRPLFWLLFGYIFHFRSFILINNIYRSVCAQIRTIAFSFALS